MFLGIDGQDVAQLSSPLPGSVGFADFVNHIYTFESTSGPLTAAHVVDHPELIATGGGGLILTAGGTLAGLLNEFFYYIAGCQFTMVIRLDFPVGAFPTIFSIDNEPTSNYSASIFLQYDGSGFGFDLFDNDNQISANRNAYEDNGSSVEGPHKIAILRTDAVLAMSIDGHVQIVDNSVSMPLPNTNDATPPGGAGAVMTHVTLGGYAGGTVDDDLTIKSITLYPPVTPDQLPFMSA